MTVHTNTTEFMFEKMVGAFFCTMDILVSLLKKGRLELMIYRITILARLESSSKKNPSSIIWDYVELEPRHSLSNSSMCKLQSIVLEQANGNEDVTAAQSLINFLDSVPGLE